MTNNYEEFKALLNEYMPEQESEELRRKVVGTIIGKDRNYSYLEVAGEPKAIRVRSEELKDFNTGDEVEVIILAKIEENDDEILIASKRKIDEEKKLEELKEAFETGKQLKGKVKEKINGGYVVDIFNIYQGFLPNSLAELRGEEIVGKEIDFIVKELKEERKRRKILLSRKELVVAKELENISKYQVGDIVKATVVEVLEFGLTVKVDEVRGFIHISEVDWKKTTDLSKLYNVGDEIEAKIIEVNKEKRNLKLSIKNLTKNPWEVVVESYKVGDEVEAKILRIEKFGAIAQLIPAVEGLIHISDFSWTAKKINLNSMVKIGDSVKVVITELNPEARKLKLSIKELSKNPWADAEERFKIGSILKGKVVEVKPFGVFAQIEEGVDCFIHNSDFAWTGNVKFEKGEEVEFKVIELDIDAQKIKGSIKMLTESPWEKTMKIYKVGDIVEKPIKNIQEFGVFVKLEDGVDGFIPTQLLSKAPVKNANELFKVGDLVKAEIIEIDNEKQRIKLSIKKLELQKEREENRELIEKYGVSSSIDE